MKGSVQYACLLTEILILWQILKSTIVYHLGPLSFETNGMNKLNRMNKR